MAKTTKKTATKKVAASTGTGVSVAKQFTQENIPAMLETITEKIASLKGASVKVPSTKGKDLPGFGRLEEIKCLETLIKAHSSVSGKSAAFDKSHAILAGKDGKKVPHKIEGLAPSTWLTEIQERYNEVSHEAEIKQLEEAKKLLEASLSEKDKLNNTLSKIGAMFAS